jgi:hypothetical protein
MPAKVSVRSVPVWVMERVRGATSMKVDKKVPGMGSKLMAGVLSPAFLWAVNPRFLEEHPELLGRTPEF